MDTIDGRIEAAKNKLKQLSAQKQQREARKRTEESKRKRIDDTRRKILVGAAIVAKVERGEWPQARLLDMLVATLTCPDDRALFDLQQQAPTSSAILENSNPGQRQTTQQRRLRNRTRSNSIASPFNRNLPNGQDLK